MTANLVEAQDAVIAASSTTRYVEDRRLAYSGVRRGEQIVITFVYSPTSNGRKLREALESHQNGRDLVEAAFPGQVEFSEGSAFTWTSNPAHEDHQIITVHRRISDLVLSLGGNRVWGSEINDLGLEWWNYIQVVRKGVSDGSSS